MRLCDFITAVQLVDASRRGREGGKVCEDLAIKDRENGPYWLVVGVL